MQYLFSPRRRSAAVALLVCGAIMATSAPPIVVAFSSNATTGSTANEATTDVLAKAHADSKEDGSDRMPPWMHGGGNDRNGSWRGPPPDDRNRSDSHRDDDDEIIPASCGYYARRKMGCSKPRTCRDCLDMDGCMVNQFGSCVNMSKQSYEPSMDYHVAFDLGLVGANATNSTQSQRYHFPAINATYCPTTDETCFKCKTTVFAGDVTDSRFCVGANNCICIATCEASGWEQLAGGMRCGPPPKPKSFSVEKRDEPPKAEEKSSGVNWRDVWTMGGIPALVVIVGILVIRSNRRETRRREEAARRSLESDTVDGDDNNATDNARATRPGRLNLPGWQNLRNQQIKKENLLLDGASEDVSPKHRFVDLLEAQPDPVNPQVTILAAPVMGAVMVEASAPSMSPRDHGGIQPSAPMFDDDFEFDQEDIDMV